MINVILAIIMFGIALDLRLENFKALRFHIKALLVGLFSQIVLLPLLSFLLVLLFEPEPSIALGMILVAACPGGNISNFMSSLAKANVALSIGMTAVVGILAVALTPFNLQFYGNLYPPTKEILEAINLDWRSVALSIFFIIVLPLFLGMSVNKKFPGWSEKIHQKFKVLSMLVFILIVLGALAANFHFFLEYFEFIFFIVLVHNSLALATGFTMSKLFGLSQENTKTLTIETGIQNSGLGLILIFSFFNGLGGMAMIAAWWGIWHIVSGLSIAFYWSKKSLV